MTMCERGESNPHIKKILDPKSSASAISATLALKDFEYINFNNKCQCFFEIEIHIFFNMQGKYRANTLLFEIVKKNYQIKLTAKIWLDF